MDLIWLVDPCPFSGEVFIFFPGGLPHSCPHSQLGLSSLVSPFYLQTDFKEEYGNNVKTGTGI